MPRIADGLKASPASPKVGVEFVLESAHVGIWDLDLPVNRLARSLTLDQLFGLDKPLPKWSYDTFLARVHPHDRARMDVGYKDLLRRGGKDCVEFRVLWPDGSVHWLSGHGSVFHGMDGSPVRVVGVLSDVTERKQMERTAFEAANRFSSLVNSMGDAVISCTLDGNITSWNRAAERLFGWTEAEIVGRELSLLAPPDLLEESRSLRAAVVRGETLRDVDTIRCHRDGSLVEVALTVSPLLDSDGAVVAMTGIVRDITDRRRLENDLKHQVLHDPLTGLPNRVLLGDRLEHAVVGAQRSGLPVAVLVLDLDHFKTVNDVAGHAVGDRLLVETAGRLHAVLRPEDSIARLSGDEFVVVCEHTDGAAALEVAERLHAALAVPVTIEGRRFSVTISVGVAVSAALSADTLLRSADAAMYDAKAAGRARTSLFTKPMAARAESTGAVARASRGRRR